MFCSSEVICVGHTLTVLYWQFFTDSPLQLCTALYSSWQPFTDSSLQLCTDSSLQLWLFSLTPFFHFFIFSKLIVFDFFSDPQYLFSSAPKMSSGGVNIPSVVRVGAVAQAESFRGNKGDDEVCASVPVPVSPWGAITKSASPTKTSLADVMSEQLAAHLGSSPQKGDVLPSSGRIFHAIWICCGFFITNLLLVSSFSCSWITRDWKRRCYS